MRILITGGGTVEKIDNMRTITNESTGRTAYELAKSFSDEHEVTLLLSKKSPYIFEKGRTICFLSGEDLYQEIVKLSTEQFDVIIHAAAVGDYSVAAVESQQDFSPEKIPSGINDLRIKLKPTRKIINEFKTLFPNSPLVGFKLTADLGAKSVIDAVTEVMKNSKADLVVQNYINERQSGLDRFSVYDSQMKSEAIDEITALGVYLMKRYQVINLGVHNDTLS